VLSVRSSIRPKADCVKALGCFVVSVRSLTTYECACDVMMLSR